MKLLLWSRKTNMTTACLNRAKSGLAAQRKSAFEFPPHLCYRHGRWCLVHCAGCLP